MTSTTYKLVFEGKIAAQTDIAIVKKKLMALFKSGPGDIERLFSNAPVVIKKGLDHSTASKYQKAIENSGALCRIVNETGTDRGAAMASPGRTAAGSSCTRAISRPGVRTN